MRISSSGIRAVEERRSDRIALDFSLVQQFVTVNNPSAPVQVGGYNVAVVHAIGQLIEQIEKSDAPEAEKAEAKSRIHRMLEHPLVAAVVGAIAGGIANAVSR